MRKVPLKKFIENSIPDNMIGEIEDSIPIIEQQSEDSIPILIKIDRNKKLPPVMLMTILVDEHAKLLSWRLNRLMFSEDSN